MVRSRGYSFRSGNYTRHGFYSGWHGGSWRAPVRSLYSPVYPIYGYYEPVPVNPYVWDVPFYNGDQLLPYYYNIKITG